MKKLIVAAMMVLGATTAFAGDSDALKAVMKAKTYAEAEALLKQNLGQLANDAEKAKAYNKLVDLSMKAYNDQQSIMQTNQIMKKNDPIDENAMNEGAYNALLNAVECYKYDQLPNAKGKLLSLVAMPLVYGQLVFSSLMQVRLLLRTTRLTMF